MPVLSLEQLTTPLTRAEVTAKIYEILGTIGVDTTSWKPGAVARTIIAACAIVMSAFSTLQAQIARSGFLELAAGPWLTLVARYVYGVERIEATFASGELTLVNAGGGIYNLDPDDLTITNTTTGKTYRNTAAFSLGALSTLTIPIYATEAGAASTAQAGEIDDIESPALTSVTCSNALAVVGLDEELDPALRIRCAEKLGALSPMGPWDAYNYAAKNARRVDGSLVGVTRVRSIKDGYGNVTTYVASATGAVTGDPDDPDTDLGAVNEAIQRLAAPLTITAFVESATPVTLAISYRVWMYNTSGLTQAQIVAAIAARLAAFVPGQPVGGNVITGSIGRIYLDAIRTVIGSTLPEIFRVELTVPTVDLELDPEEVATLGAVTAVAINQVPRPEGAM